MFFTWQIDINYYNGNVTQIGAPLHVYSHKYWYISGSGNDAYIGSMEMVIGIYCGQYYWYTLIQICTVVMIYKLVHKLVKQLHTKTINLLQ